MIVRSPYPNVLIPDVAIASFILERARALGEKPALIDGPSGRVTTYADLAAQVDRCAAGLARHGLRKGETLAILLPNCPQYAVTLLAIWRLGAVATTVNPLYTAAELAGQMRDAHACYLLTVPQMLEKARQAVAEAPVREIFVLGEAPSATPFAELLAGDEAPPAVAIDPGDIAVLPYSSGTTGLPKGVMLTHGNLVANLVQTRAAISFGEDERLIAVLPFYHIYGMVVILALSLYLGSTIITVPRFELEEFLRVLQEQRVTRALLVPPIILALAKHPLVDQYDLSSLRSINSGAAPVSEGVMRACAARLGCKMLQGYGMTETAPVTHCIPEEMWERKLGSVGVLIPNTECKVIDPYTGVELEAGEPGEICVRGPQVMRGYLNRRAATAAMIDGAGWLATGDVGYFDDDGYFYVVDRVKELIKYKGMQVAPAELEAVLLTHPAVADAAVIPSPDEEAGELPMAYVVRRSEVTAEEITAYVAERVAPHKKIRKLEFIDAIPKSAAGKILRRVLRERERAGAR